MPTVNETLQTVRGAATVNSAALASVRAQVTAHLTLVELFPTSSNKGRVRDQLNRVAAAFDKARAEVLRVITDVDSALGSAGPLPPDPEPEAITWSTADF